MNLRKLLIIVLTIGIISACSEKKTEKKEISIIKDTLTPFIIPTLDLNNENFVHYTIDTAKSIIHWNASYHFGGLKYKSGNLSFNKSALSEAVFSIDMNSITNTDIDYELMQGTLVNVLKSVEFFNTQVYPEAYFVLKQVYQIKDNNYDFSGDFIILNKSVPNHFKGTIVLEKDSLFFDTESIILNRTDWGIYYLSENNPHPIEGEDGFYVSDTILIETHITAYKK